VGGDPYIFGAQSGKKAVAVLKGTKPSLIPIESPLKIEVLVNKKSARDAQVQIPKSVMQNVTKTFE
jgi:ABC-type uncharacterized transport system substrate-binding protein